MSKKPKRPSPEHGAARLAISTELHAKLKQLADANGQKLQFVVEKHLWELVERSKVAA